MIIDAILDRKDGHPYTYETAKYIYDESMIFKMWHIADAFDCGDNADMQNALCDYIDYNNYNPEIKNYIRSVNWEI
jgi:hypothetical protein